MARYELIATTAFGLESVVARELKLLGIEPTQTHNGYVEFSGDERTVVNANLWLRSADRVLLKMGQFHAETFDELFEGTKALPWPELLPKDARFPVEGRSVKSVLHSVPAVQSIVKKAVVDGLKRQYKLEVFPETGALYSIEVSLLKDEAVITVDTSGTALHKRGYRKLTAAAPIKETLAAALVSLSYWRPNRPFADPMCGSGTIAIEAALMARNMAPGLKRDFASEMWSFIDPGTWQRGRQEARAAARPDIEVDIVASDIDPSVLSLAEYHARQAGVGDCVSIVQRDVRDFVPQGPYGCVVTNPPYGERLGEIRENQQLVRDMGKVFNALDTWSVFVIAADPEFEKFYGRKANKKRKLYNGRIQTNYYQYLGPLPPLKRDADGSLDSAP